MAVGKQKEEPQHGGAEFELVRGGVVTPLEGDWVIRLSSGAFEIGPGEMHSIANVQTSSVSGEIAAAPSRMVAHLESESREYYDSLGPWATGRAVCEALDVTHSALGQWRKSHKILGVAFGRKGDYFYPVQQFVDGDVVRGLRDVLIALSTGFRSPEAQAGWLAEPAYEIGGEVRWDVLRSGDVETVVEWAAADARAIAS
jgi:hypothetical protein